MRFSEAWLREFVDPPVDTSALGAQLTMAGLELDSIEPAAPAFENVVVAHVQSVEQHPDADRLRVCRVDPGDGSGELLNIVCGAPNVRPNMRVALARIGAVLPGGLKIKRSKLRGVVSQGMLCSTRELGLGEEHDGIMDLPAEAPLGSPLRDYLALDDAVIEIDLTPNRGDCLGLLGLAREVSALNGIDRRAEAVVPVDASHGVSVEVTLSAPAGCPVYAGRVVRGINPCAATPIWMQERLRRSGVRSIHPVVDVTNYVLLERGQPMHGFDYRKLQGSVDVRLAQADESLTLLDGKELDLDPDMLVITDARGPIALAGIMGGESTMVDDGTVDVFFESAYFAPESVAGRARRIGLHTDASHRYERGVDPEGQVAALERATALLIDIAGGEAGPVTLAREEAALPPRVPVPLRRERLDGLIGIHVPGELVEDRLSRLGMQVTASDDGWTVTPPSYRFDIAIEADLVEEVVRLYGYDNVPEQAETTTLAGRQVTESLLRPGRFKALLAARDYQEAITYSFVDPKLLRSFDVDQDKVATLINPISADLSVMRPSVLPGLLAALQQNVARQQSRVRLFEIGPRYSKQATGFKEEFVIAGVVCGKADPEGWAQEPRAADFFDVKADVEALASLGGSAASFAQAERAGMHPGQTAMVALHNQDVGFVGAVHPRVCAAMALPDGVYGFELTLDALARAALPQFEPVSRFPSIRRDLALLLPESVTAASLCATIEEAGGALLQRVVLFDEYRGEKVDSGLKSIALGLILQESSRNLTSEEADEVVDRVRQQVEQSLNGRIRD
jgi:phenylalanyl-tRNA synthetase beta chain